MGCTYIGTFLLDVEDDLFQAIDAECFFEGPDTFDVVCVTLAASQDLVLGFVDLNGKLVLTEVVNPHKK